MLQRKEYIPILYVLFFSNWILSLHVGGLLNFPIQPPTPQTPQQQITKVDPSPPYEHKTILLLLTHIFIIAAFQKYASLSANPKKAKPIIVSYSVLISFMAVWAFYIIYKYYKDNNTTPKMGMNGLLVFNFILVFIYFIVINNFIYSYGY